MEDKEVMVELVPPAITKSPLLQFGDMRKREVDDMAKDKQTRKTELMMALLALREKAMQHEEWYKEKKKKEWYKDE